MIATMLKGSTDVSRWLLLTGLLCCVACQSLPSSSFENKTDTNDSKPRVFSPRMDYDEWTPLGRGDPLKNNPTFDYVPPVLDRVQYWLDSHTTEASAKRDILVLGVTAKKTSPKIPEQFLKFVDGPKFTRTNQDNTYRNDFTGSSGAEPPKVLRTTNFRNGLVDYRNQNRIQAASYYPSPYYNQKTKPYTMMLPPPVVQKQIEPSTAFNGILSKEKITGYVEPSQQLSTQTEEGPVLQDPQYYGIPSKNYNQHHSPSLQPSRPQYLQTPSKLPTKGVGISQIETIKNVYTPFPSTKPRYDVTTTPSVSFEKSNLIYQSTQTISGGWLANNGPTSTLPDVNQVTWQTPDHSRDHYDTDHHVAASSNHEVVIGQNANIIVDGENNENEEVVVGEKSTPPFDILSSSSPIISSETMPSNSTFNFDTKIEENDEESSDKTSPKMHIVVANSPSTIDLEAQNKTPVAVIMPTNYINKHNQTISTESPVVSTNVSENLTSEMEKVQQSSKTQIQTNTMTSSFTFAYDPSTPTSTPNRMISHQHHQIPHQSVQLSMTPSRHMNNPTHMFGSGQSISSMHSLTRPNNNHGMMHFIGSMRPNVGFRPPPPMTMSHMAPHMSHMHAPALKGMVGPTSSIDQTHPRPPQMQSGFPGSSYTSLPAPTTLTLQTVEGEDEMGNRYQSNSPPEMTTTSTSSVLTSTVPFMELSSSTSTKNSEGEEPNQSSLAILFADEESSKNKPTIKPESTTAIPPQTTTVPSLTTDPIFSHYKQPAKPIKGPMYLIIQGHSKVKTYKPTINKHGVPVNNEIVDNITERPLSKFEQLIIENTKNGKVDKTAEEKKKLEEKIRAEKRASTSQDSLMSLVESGLGSFTVPHSSSVTETEHFGNSVTTVEVNGN
ncbi:mucin-5AC [Polistes fuscatus]|uniref:mucin-5AC n=1 Tax=Polistes fuscatus TaxID=30207 RepID=UPI001CA85A68|nr:mucin-5AC [Polistes fuscatus]